VSYRAGDPVAQGVQFGLSFVQNPVGAVASFLTDQLLGSIFGESTHEKYMRWLANYQIAEAKGRKMSATAKRAIARAAFRATPAATRLSMRSPAQWRRLLARRNR
jgi:hypothetical protein